MISSIISAQSTDVDTVSGATFSSTGIINAVVDALGKAENAWKKRQRKVRLIRAVIQLIFFIVAPALFSTAFAGVKSIFQAIAAGSAGDMEFFP